DGGWHHIVVTTPTAVDATSTTIAKVGSYLNGSMDDVRFYSRELSSGEVERLYQLGATTHIATTITTNDSLENGLIGHWTFDGPNMDFSASSAEVIDSSPSGNDGDWQATTQIVRPGVLGQGIYMNGSSNDQVNITNESDYDFTSSDSFSYGGWIQPFYDDHRSTIVSHYGSGWNFGVEVQENGEINAYMDDSTDTIGENDGATANFDEWNHIMVVLNRADDTMTRYLNGVQIGTIADASTIDNITPSILDIGRRGDLTNTCNCVLDDIRIYNRAVTAEEIQRLYELGATTNIAKTLDTIDILEQDLIAHWTFDGPTIDSSSSTAEIRDASDNPNFYGNWIGSPNNATKPGKLGQAIHLRSEGSNNPIRLASSTALNLGTDDFSWSFWYNSTSPTSQQAIAGSRGGGAAIGLHIRINGTAGKLDTYICDDCSGSGQTVTYSDSSNYDEPGWHHVVATFDRDGNVTYYHNGVEDGTGNISGQQGSITDDVDWFCLGATGCGASAYTQFYGLLDDIRVYRRVLTQEEVTRLYELGGG
ncbi:LamG domain-containing protein, partial [candidate division WWE3 bacterium]|nr:LamG domain-containing protein [candidate division WWE3 bacterium]